MSRQSPHALAASEPGKSLFVALRVGYDGQHERRPEHFVIENGHERPVTFAMPKGWHASWAVQTDANGVPTVAHPDKHKLRAHRDRFAPWFAACKKATKATPSSTPATAT